MSEPIILASGSQIRRQLLENAGLTIATSAAKIDEDLITSSLLQEQATARDIADVLAEMKAQKVSFKAPDALVIGCDQVLECDGTLFTKPSTKDEARVVLQRLSGKTHRLMSAAVVYEAGKPQWRHVGVARMTVHELSQNYIANYVDRNWEEIRFCVGCYQLEAEGVRLFSRIAGDYFTILGLPLLELLSYLRLRGTLPT